MQLHLTPRDGLPIYRQIVNQVKYLLAAGRLAPGEELPAIRTLAEQLVINPNTVARAYLELERAGLVTKRQGSGTYASDTRSPLRRGERLRLLTERADALLAEARHLEIEIGEVLELLRERSKTMQPQEAK
jgi:GntR family transcriptional regulator